MPKQVSLKISAILGLLLAHVSCTFAATGWLLHVTGSGSGSVSENPEEHQESGPGTFTAPADATNTISVNGMSDSTGGWYCHPGTMTASANVT